MRTGWINAVAHLESLIDIIRGFHSYSGKHLALRYRQIFALSSFLVGGDVLTSKHRVITFRSGRLVMGQLPILIPQSQHRKNCDLKRSQQAIASSPSLSVVYDSLKLPKINREWLERKN